MYNLLTITHDPDGKNLELWIKCKEIIEKYYHEIYMCVSHETSNELLSALNDSRVNIKVIPKKGVSHARRSVVQFCSEHSTTTADYHYCDFDRLLTWVDKFPNELKSILDTPLDCDYLILGRSEQAMETHPVEWKKTEEITNYIFSEVFGQQVDITAGSCMFCHQLSSIILLYSKGSMTDAEWPAIVQRIKKSVIGYRAVDGLMYIEEVNGIRKELADIEKWISRLKLCVKIAESAEQITISKE
ncbi:hypothetical protein ACFQ4N_05335 [Oceanobacillus iheyensis]|uniref:Glycosyltransferase n=1 Tax=Oceanobacillus iheyensis (strain DSM 14371 / CIP 107618 / JCM 11309 / KCTC 3954 / HTE831) TaxID=221109 RepID=Q8CUU9_OCEIH|nr:hypothetical protein [Oceanobacillus iheyensis]BAC12964.1 hypothetical protein [Oceanobacillus iheyensis HTE831]